MSARTTETSGGEDANSQPRANRVASTIGKRGRDGSIALLAGGAVLGWALRTARKRGRRAAPLALPGLALLGIGARQQRTERREGDVETGADARRGEDGRKTVSDDAHVEAARNLGAQRNADESRSVDQSAGEPNPRGTFDGSDVRTDDGGDVDFVEGKEPGTHRETHLEDEGAYDPRLHPEDDDERTQVDLSEAAMADEASEAAGPHPEQAYPTLEGTDPEPTSAKAPERVNEGDAAPAGTDAEEHPDGDEAGESEKSSD